jgi:hypothetical protein
MFDSIYESVSQCSSIQTFIYAQPASQLSTLCHVNGTPVGHTGPILHDGYLGLYSPYSTYCDRSVSCLMDGNVHQDNNEICAIVNCTCSERDIEN